MTSSSGVSTFVLFCFVFVFMLSLKPRAFVQSSFDRFFRVYFLYCCRFLLVVVVVVVVSHIQRIGCQPEKTTLLGGDTDRSSTHRARSLRNLLVSGNECGRVFPAGVGPGSPSRDAANWLPSRFSLSVETRRRYGWLRMMVFPGARLFPSPNLVPFGRVAARERQGALSRRV